MTVEELITKLKEFPQSMQVEVGGDGVFQGSPRDEDIFVQNTDYGKAVIIWGNNR